MKLPSLPTQAIFLFLYVMLSNAMVIGIVRHISTSFSIFQIVLCQFAFGLACFAPWLIRRGLGGVKTTRIKLYGLRAALEFGAFSLSFLSLTMIPLPMHTSLLFTISIFGTLIAIFVLRERPTIHAIACIAAGFVGVLVITRPGIVAFDIGIVYALLSAIGFACCGNVIKLLTRTESASMIAFYMLLISSLIATPFGLYHWVMPQGVEWGWLIAIGLLSYSQQIAIARALAHVPYTTIIPLNFAQLVFVSIISYIFFAELIDLWTVVGAAIIIAGTLYNAYHTSKTPLPIAA
jgi:drug/metabolite transporter (DMT)-like permease